MEQRANRLFLVIPCYNEEAVIKETAQQLLKKYNSLQNNGMIASDSKICFVNDGSKDHTWNIIRSLHQENPTYTGLSLTRNRGHQNALLAGLLTVMDQADIVISMDADLQDDIQTIDAMLHAYQEGNEIVYGVRSSRQTDTFFKRFSAESFYRLLQMMGVEIIYNHADFRLMSKKALQGLSEFQETNLFLRGMVPMIGYKSTTVTYERHERFAGKSKYPLTKMISFAFDGITSLSIRPIRMISNLGILISIVSLLFLIWSVFTHYFGYTVDGWTSLLASIWLVGGLEMLSLGVIGEYIGKIYNETKHRPRYIIEEYLD